jgi:AcrR family transcriptional regulator
MQSKSDESSKKEQILAAAIRVLARDGLSRATTRAIAKEANVNIATLHYYFGGKEKLLVAILKQLIQQTSKLIKDVIPGEKGLESALAEGIEAFWEFVETAPELQVVQYELTVYSLRNANSSWLAKQLYQDYKTLAARLLRGLYKETVCMPAIQPEELADFIIAGLDGLILQYVVERDKDAARRRLDTLIHATQALIRIGVTHQEFWD